MSRSVFKENVRLNEALGYHLKEAEELKKSNKALEEENVSLILDKVQYNHYSGLPLAHHSTNEHTNKYLAPQTMFPPNNKSRKSTERHIAQKNMQFPMWRSPTELSMTALCKL